MTEEQLDCPLCLDTYTDPKQLQCHHIFCQQCLLSMVVRDQLGQLGLSCPSCHHITPIPERGVAGLQPAFCINRFLEYQDALKTLADTAKKLVASATIDTAENSADRPARLPYCLKHVKEEARLYCGMCNELVCLQCIMKGGSHHDHEYTLLNEAFEKQEQEITSLLGPMDMQVSDMKKTLTLLGTCCGEISDQQAATKGSVHATFERLREVLNVRETELVNKIDKLTQGKLKSLAVQKDQIETTLVQLSSCLLLIRESDKEKYLLTIKAKVIEEMKALSNLFRPHHLEPCSEADMTFSATEEAIVEVCLKHGEVFVPVIDPSKCYATGNGVEAAIVGERSTNIIQVVNIKGDLCKGIIKSLDCEITSEIKGITAHCSVKRNVEGQYEISYMPMIKGRHQLHIKVEDEHIRGSPFSVAVTSSSLKLDVSMLTIGELVKPWGVVTTRHGEIVVSEMSKHCISVFSPNGEKLRSFHTYGYGEYGELTSEPRGLTVDSEGNILVADCKNHRIQKFTVEGHFIKAVGTHGSGDLQFSSPSRIEYNSSNNKFYVADGNCRVQILNSDLTYCGTFGGPGTGMGLFHSDYILGGIACDSTGNVYVTDLGNTRIQVFTPEGELLRMFGKCGCGEGELYCPDGIAIDSNDLIYVSENGNQRISVFTSTGQFVTSRGGLNRPRGLTVDDCGLVYVCNTENMCVQVF